MTKQRSHSVEFKRQVAHESLGGETLRQGATCEKQANGYAGANGTSISSTLDGRWVNTIVLISPIRSPIGTAIRHDMAEQTLPQNRMAAAVAIETWNVWYSHNANSD